LPGSRLCCTGSRTCTGQLRPAVRSGVSIGMARFYSAVPESLASRTAGLLRAVRESRDAGVAGACNVRDAAYGVAGSVRERGLRACSRDAVQAVRRMIAEIASSARASGNSKFEAACRIADQAFEDAIVMVEHGAKQAFTKAVQAASRTRATAQSVSSATSNLVSQKSFQTTAASSVGGALALGTGGGAAGLAAGGMVGGMVGVPFAFFTFGLSVPFGMAIGGGIGLVGGVAAGATTGAVSGGFVGYGVYAKKDQITGVAKRVAAKGREGSDCVKGAAQMSVSYVKDTMSTFVSAGTGGTGKDD